MKSATAVGYFVASTKIMQMVKGVSSSLGTVMMPRISNLVATKKMKSLKF